MASGAVEARHLAIFAMPRVGQCAQHQPLGAGTALAVQKGKMVLRIDFEQRDDETVLLLIGSITSPDVQQLKALMAGVRNRVVLDLAQVQRVGLDAAHFLAAAERSGTKLRRVPRYVREWILLENSRVAEPQGSDLPQFITHQRKEEPWNAC